MANDDRGTLQKAAEDYLRDEAEAALIGRLVRKVNCADLTAGACRACGAPGEFGLAEYEPPAGCGGKGWVELCYVCGDCRRRNGGSLRLLFRGVYLPAWPE